MTWTLETDSEGHVEDMDMYKPGGFLPVDLGTFLGVNDRFEVIAKLGSGGNATVWLCRDHLHCKWKAIKILTSLESQEVGAELRMMYHFKSVKRATLEDNYIFLPVECFLTPTPYGNHLCFVMPVLGDSILHLRQILPRIPDILRDLCSQMVKAMAFLHRNGVCHGDFRAGNILLQLKGIDDLSKAEILALMAPAEKIPIIYCGKLKEGESSPERPSYYPTALYTSTKFYPALEMNTLQIAVTDFGEAYHAFDPPPAYSNSIPYPYAAPEVILPGETPMLSFGTDLWALGAAICELRTGYLPFADGNPLQVFLRLQEVLGPLPEPYRSNFLGLFGQGNENLLKEVKGSVDWLEESVRRGVAVDDRDDTEMNVVHEMPHVEADLLLDLLRRIFRYAVDERLSLSKISAHPWFSYSNVTKSPAITESKPKSKKRALTECSSRVILSRCCKRVRHG